MTISRVQIVLLISLFLLASCGEPVESCDAMNIVEACTMEHGFAPPDVDKWEESECTELEIDVPEEVISESSALCIAQEMDANAACLDTGASESGFRDWQAYLTCAMRYDALIWKVSGESTRDGHPDLHRMYCIDALTGELLERLDGIEI